MKQKHKILAGWIAFIYVIFHTVMISISTLPETIVSTERKSELHIYNAYTHPIFTQDWRMFYPCAKIEGHFKMKIYYEDEVVDWFYPTKEAREWYKWIKFTHHGELVLIEFNHAHWLAWDLITRGWEINDPATHGEVEGFKTSYSYDRIKNYAYSTAIHLKDKEPRKVEVICELRDVVTDIKAAYRLPDYQWSK